jgi:solute carrier family 9B (sodium/hydrogen exchanger), member 1/2
MQFFVGWRTAVLTLIVATTAYLLLWLLFGTDVLPPSTTFSIVVVFLVGAAAGLACYELLHIPALIGMLLAGVLMTNATDLTVDKEWSATIRLAALAVILLRAGLDLEWSRVKDTVGAAVLLTILPSAAEATAVALLARPLLGFPWLWCWLLALANIAVSPAIIVPQMIDLQSRGYGVEKRIPTLLVTAASLNDVLVILAFTVLLGECLRFTFTILTYLYVTART